MRVLISGGGTAGHVYPALAIAAELAKNAPPARTTSFLFVGRARSIEERLVRASGMDFRVIDVGGVRSMDLRVALRNGLKLFSAIRRVRAVIREFQPDAILATGGYVSAPVVWASALEKIPSVIYLPDLAPGWAIRFSARWATRIAVSFEPATRFFPRGKATVTGYPVRVEFLKTDRVRARAFFNLDPRAPVITILGGSRGAHAINQAVAQHLPELARVTQIIWITGLDDEMAMKEKTQGFERVRVFGYLNAELPHALAAADLVIARAGASVLGELPAVGVPAILVPYPYAGGHQELNARFLIERGAAVKIDNADLEREIVSTTRKLLGDAAQLENMQKQMRALARPDAAAQIADLIRAIAV
ncbi:MAG: undecaprenyldiphospho-muramoylpentapeptide beta-N-acetylglucosaminyltransferase [Chloroflexi bacterium]|nr:undecaprenyldiphospho-muramoylpentapeptide beta-N-acetylglucosaminyltransferase [Chloroflexota bacterium]